MDVRRPGKKTYTRFLIRSCFDKDYFENKFEEIGDKIKNYSADITASYSFREWANINPTSIISVVDHKKNNRVEIKITVNRKGWNIVLQTVNNSEIFPQLSLEVFGDKNKREAWTQQNSLVPEMTIELIKKVRELLHERKR